MDWNAFYSSLGIPASNPVSPYMTPSELQKLEEEIAASKALQASLGPIQEGPSWGQPTEMDIAAIDKWNADVSNGAVTPGPAMAYGAPKAETPASAAAAGVAEKPKAGGLVEALFGPAKNGLSGGLAGLLGVPANSGLLGALIASELPPSQAYAAANSAAREQAGAAIGHTGSGRSSGNLGGVSSSGRRYDFDRNEWI